MIELSIQLRLHAFSLDVQLTLETPAVVVLGPSGAGKTSLLESIAGIRPGAVGRIALDGQVLLDSQRGTHLPPEARRIGYVPQEGLLFPHLNVRDNVHFGLRRRPFSHLLDQLVSILEIGPLLSRYPSTLSGGERQRVALARALATQPRLLLLDEPLGALDVTLKERILPYLLRVRDVAQVPMIYVTHYTGEARLIGREVVVLQDGRVVAHGDPSQIVESGATLRLLGPNASLDNLMEGVVEEADSMSTAALRVGEHLTVRVPGSPGLIAGSRAVFAVPAEDVLISNHSLDEISARNSFAGEVAAMQEVGPDVILRVLTPGYHWLAKLTRTAVLELGIQPHSKVFVVVKTHSFRRVR